MLQRVQQHIQKHIPCGIDQPPDAKGLGGTHTAGIGAGQGAALNLAAAKGGIDIEAQTFRRCALHFSKTDFQHHLLRAADIHQIGNLVSRIGTGEIHRRIHLSRAGDRAGKHDTAIRLPHLDFLIREHFANALLQFGKVRRHPDIDIGDQASVLAQQGQCSRTRVFAEDIDGPVGKCRNISNFRVCDGDFGKSRSTFQNNGAADEDIHIPRCRTIRDTKNPARDLRLCPVQICAAQPCRNQGHRDKQVCPWSHEPHLC